MRPRPLLLARGRLRRLVRRGARVRDRDRGRGRDSHRNSRSNSNSSREVEVEVEAGVGRGRRSGGRSEGRRRQGNDGRETWTERMDGWHGRYVEGQLAESLGTLLLDTRVLYHKICMVYDDEESLFAR